MAQFNEILVGRFNRALQKVTGIKGQAPAPQIAAEITPAFNFPIGAEFRYLDSWFKFGANITQVAVAAQISQIRFRNPTGSNVIACFEKITFWGTLADQPGFSILAGLADLATAVALTNNRFDARGNPTPTLIASRTTVAGPLAPTHWEGGFVANSSQDVIFSSIQEFPLLPGDAITLQGNFNKHALNASVWWR